MKYISGLDFLIHFFYILHTFIKDGVKLSVSRGRLKAECVLLVLLLRVLKPLLWTHTEHKQEDQDYYFDSEGSLK